MADREVVLLSVDDFLFRLAGLMLSRIISNKLSEAGVFHEGQAEGDIALLARQVGALAAPEFLAYMNSGTYDIDPRPTLREIAGRAVAKYLDMGNAGLC